MQIFGLAIKSLRNRKFTAGLTIVSIALSVTLLLGVERIRREAQTSFTNTISGTDLIVGARTSPVQLLLSSVFGLSDATNNIGWESYESISSHPGIPWTIPISLGDTHAGYRVLGTTGTYFDHFRYGRKQALQIKDGGWLTSEVGAVLGAEVAEKLGYRVGSDIVVAHGSGEISFMKHDAHPFHVAGILARTGTPDGWGVNASWQQWIDDKWLPFVRGGYTEDSGSLLEESVTVGLGYQPLPMRGVIGLGFNWGKPCINTIKIQKKS
jgi:putative ABC transport system permease protein